MVRTIKSITTVYVEPEILEKARRSGLNVSKFLENKLKEYFETSDKVKSILVGERSKILELEVKKFIEDCEGVENWRKFVMGRVRLINAHQRIGLSENEFESLVIEAKKDGVKENDFHAGYGG